MSKPGRNPEDTDEEILDVFRNSEDPVLTAGEVAEHLSIGRRATHNRLVALQERGVLKRKDIGPRTVWWISQTDADGAPAAPLRDLVGLLDEDEADRARERSEEWREEFNRDMTDTGDV